MKLKNILFRIFQIASVIMVISIFGTFIYMENAWSRYLTSNEKDQIISEIKSSPQLPERILNIYNVVYPESLDGNLWNYIFTRSMHARSESRCPCYRAVRFATFEKRKSKNEYYFIAPVLIGLEIEDYASQSECLSFIAYKTDFQNGIIGIEEASKYYLKKDLNSLNDSEVIDLLIIMRNPPLHNKYEGWDKYESLRQKMKKNWAQHVL